MSDKPKNPAAVALGSMTSLAKARASRINGKLGGRPKKKRRGDDRAGNSRNRRAARRAAK